MKLDEKIETALNQQINQEMAAAYGYLAAAAWFDAENLKGFSSWMRAQREEELVHAQKVIDYLLDRGGRLELEAVAKPLTRFESVMQVFQKALESEQANTHSIHELYRLSLELNDYSTQSFLKWFVDEQVEEERVVGDAIGLLEHAGDDKSALLVLNQQFGERTAGAESA